MGSIHTRYWNEMQSADRGRFQEGNWIAWEKCMGGDGMSGVDVA